MVNFQKNMFYSGDKIALTLKSLCALVYIQGDVKLSRSIILQYKLKMFRKNNKKRTEVLTSE